MNIFFFFRFFLLKNIANTGRKLLKIKKKKRERGKEERRKRERETQKKGEI